MLLDLVLNNVVRDLNESGSAKYFLTDFYYKHVTEKEMINDVNYFSVKAIFDGKDLNKPHQVQLGSNPILGVIELLRDTLTNGDYFNRPERLRVELILVRKGSNPTLLTYMFSLTELKLILKLHTIIIGEGELIDGSDLEIPYLPLDGFKFLQLKGIKDQLELGSDWKMKFTSLNRDEQGLRRYGLIFHRKR